MVVLRPARTPSTGQLPSVATPPAKSTPLIVDNVVEMVHLHKGTGALGLSIVGGQVSVCAFVLK
jgi:hypothetical protein